MIGVAHSAIFCIDKISFSSLFQSELFNETINSDETLKIHLWMPDPSFESWPPADSSGNPWKICSNLWNSWPVVTDRKPVGTCSIWKHFVWSIVQSPARVDAPQDASRGDERQPRSSHMIFNFKYFDTYRHRKVYFLMFPVQPGFHRSWR